MRMMLIAIVALLLVGGGGAGAYFYFVQPAEASAGHQATEGHDKKADKHAKNDHGTHGEFVELDPLILPIVDNNGVSQTISMVVALEVKDAGTAKLVEIMRPKLTDAFIQDMYGVLSEKAAMQGGLVNIAKIKYRLSKISDHVMGEGVVQDVLLQVVDQRPI